MGETTGIPWADSTWNPWRGCHPVSEGCANCYMYREQRRYGRDPSVVVRSAVRTFFAPAEKWETGRRIFVCSWSDFFIADADPWRGDAWDVIRSTRHHTYIIVTKRPERILECLPFDWLSESPRGWPHVWLLVTGETQRWLEERWQFLAGVPAKVRGVSIEPMLGRIDLRGLHPTPDWVIVGGESGPDARPVHPDWVRWVQAQCQALRVPFFFKQWGEWVPVCSVYDPDPWDKIESRGVGGCHLAALDTRGFISQEENSPRGDYCDYQPPPGSWWMARVGRRTAGHILDGREWREFPEVARG